jgi:PAS domain S-box-containing protein
LQPNAVTPIIAPMNLYGGILHPGLASVLETALDAVCVMDSRGAVTGWNERAAALFGWTSGEAIGQRLSELIIPPDLRPAHERGLAHFLATGEGPVLNHRIEVSALNRNGDEFPVELSITASEQFGDLLFIGFVRDISERKSVTERQQRLLQESDHRVKNMLAVVDAIARQTAKSADGIEDFLGKFSRRLQALSDAQSLLSGRKWQNVEIGALAEQVLGSEASDRTRHSGPDIVLHAQQVLGLSMILHELYTNAVKYGALCTHEGSIDLSWSVEGGEVTLVWTERGGTCPGTEPKGGFGQRMIDMVVKADLGGTIERRWMVEGLDVTIRFPLAG